MKISVNSIKKEIREKELEQERILLKITQAQLKAKEAQDRRNKLLDEVLTRCLETAINGDNFLDIGYEYPDLDGISNLLEDKFIEIVDIPGEKYILRKIENTFDSLNQNQREAMDKVLRARARAIKFSLNELKSHLEIYYGYDELVELVDLGLSEKNLLQETIVHLFKANITYKEFEFEFDNELPQKVKESLEIAKSEIKYDFREINEIFGHLKLKEIPGEDDYAKILRWEKMADEDVINNWTDECLDAVSFSYLSTLHGQLFVGAFKSAVEEKMSSHQNSIELQLLKYSSGSVYLSRL